MRKASLAVLAGLVGLLLASTAGAAPIIIEAESGVISDPDADGLTWDVVSDAGASSGGVLGGSDNAIISWDDQATSTRVAEVTYTFTVDTTAVYYLYARVDNRPLEDPYNTDPPLAVTSCDSILVPVDEVGDQPTGRFDAVAYEDQTLAPLGWQWSNGWKPWYGNPARYGWVLAAGQNTLTIGERDWGTAVDLLVLADSDTLTSADLYQITGVPEPATMGMLAVGGLSVLIRRRRR